MSWDSIPTKIEGLQLNNNAEIATQYSNADPGTHPSVFSQLKTDLRLVIEKLNEVCQVNTGMLNKISDLVKENNVLYDEIEDLKIELAELNQYGRRENIEICGIPEKIDHKLEEHIITVLKSVGVTVNSYQIQGVHRIGKKTPSRPRNVVVRFINRKHSFSALKNKSKLNSSKYKSYYIIENLCPFNKKIFNRLYRLKKEGEIHSVWSYNGSVYAKVEGNDEPTQIRHLLDIDDLVQGSRYEVNNGDYSESNNTPSELNSQISRSGDSDANRIHVSHIEEVDDLFNDVPSVGSSSHEDDVNATGNANVSRFSGDLVTWWDLSKAVFMD